MARFLTAQEQAQLHFKHAEAAAKTKNAERWGALEAAERWAAETMQETSEPPPVEPPPVEPPPVEPPPVEPPPVEPPPSGEIPASSDPTFRATLLLKAQPRVALTPGPNVLTTSQHGQVIQGQTLDYIHVKHDNVTITDCRIYGNGARGVFVDYQLNPRPKNTLISHCEIGRANTGQTNGMGAYILNGTIENCWIHNSSDGLQAIGGATIRECVIDGLWTENPNSHIDGIQFYAAPGTTAITDSFIDCTDNSPTNLLPNGSIFLKSGGYDPVIVHNNFLRGGGFLLRLEAGVKNARVTDNTFDKTDPRGWGTHSVQGQVVEWSGNKRADGSTVNK